MCRALRIAGVEAVVATTDADGEGRLPVVSHELQSMDDVHVVFFRRYGNEAFKYAAGFASWLDGHVREFDVVHIHAVLSHTCLAAGRACRKAGVPYIVRPLGTLDPWSLSRKPLRKRLLMQLGGQKLLSCAAAMHYTSSEEMKLAQSAVAELPRGVVIPLGIDDELFEQRRKPDSSPYVLSLGRLDEKKGVDILIRAFHRNVDAGRYAEWRLLIAGDGAPAYVTALRRMAALGPAIASIAFLGWIQGDQKLALLRNASIFALASHQENFGLSVAEAMACGVPVIVSEGVNLQGDIAAANAGWVTTREETVLASCLRAAMDDPAERKTRGEHGRGFARRFRWSAIGNQLVSLYNDVLGNCSRSTAGPSERETIVELDSRAV